MIKLIKTMLKYPQGTKLRHRVENDIQEVKGYQVYGKDIRILFISGSVDVRRIEECYEVVKNGSSKI